MKNNFGFSKTIRPRLFLALFLCWSTFLLFKGLDFAPLWSDEASTAWYARSIVNTGLPSAWDGKNIFGPLDAAEVNDQLILAYIPWFHYYLVAGSIALFGDSVWATRAPFALIGLLSVILFHFFLRKTFPEQKLVYFGSILYVHTLPFLIYSRQCRYFSLLIFFTTAWLWIMAHLEGKRRIIGLAVTFTLFLHTHYFIAACFVSALFCTGLLTWAPNKIWKEHFWSLLFASCFFLPWFFFFNPWRASIENLVPKSRNFSYFTQFLFYLEQINYNNIFPALLLLLALFAWKKSSKIGKKQFSAGLIFFFAFLLSLIFLDPGRVVAARYAVSLIPLSIFLWILCLKTISQKTSLQIIVIGLIIFTDIPSLPMFTKQPILIRNPEEAIFYHSQAIAVQRLPFLGYWNQMMHDFPRSYDVAAEMIRKHVPKNACVTTYPSYHRYPLMSLLSQEYTFCAQLFPKPQSRWSKREDLLFPESFFATPSKIESWLVVFGDEGSRRAANYDELSPQTSGLQYIAEAAWDCTAGSRPEFTIFQTQELPVKEHDARAIRLMHYIPPSN